MLFGNRPADKTAKWRVSTRSFAVLLAYTLFIWWLEVLDLLAWLLHVPQGTVLSRVAALILCGAVMAAIGRFERDHAGVSPLFIAGSLFILAFFSVKGFAPDQSYDTQNYHLLSQIPGFVDNLHYHVIPGRFQMFGFRLGDDVLSIPGASGASDGDIVKCAGDACDLSAGNGVPEHGGRPAGKKMQLVEASCAGTCISDCQPSGADSGEWQLHGRASGTAVSAGNGISASARAG